MIRKFQDANDAYTFARNYHRENTVPVWVLVTTGGAYVAGPSSLHLLPAITGSYRLGDYIPRDLGPHEDPNLDERPPLRDNGEYWYNVALCHSSGVAPEVLERIALAAMDNNSCIWHEYAREFGSPCPCRKCNR